MKELDFSKENLKAEILKDAKSINLAPGFAATISDKVSDAVEQKVNKLSTITKNDLERIVTSELKKYSADLAYIYHNRDKII
ncbi:hypothetical protein IJI94_01050 [Candidatus Saccharibacteria bacterium]|nr:hypothetical protein [Candidatus Saccharibacteria bacterium]